MPLREHQEKALARLDNGKILFGDVGTGKSMVAAQYYMDKECPRDVIVITTAKKRDSLDWEKEFVAHGIYKTDDTTIGGKLTVDSWNNITKYNNVYGAFFIFDEQRLVGNGAWVKSFQKIANKNHWILLTATPGDTWMDYAPVFIANKMYKNITEFKREHVVYSFHAKFPKIERYIGTGKLVRQKHQLLVEMPMLRHTKRHSHMINCEFDIEMMKAVTQDRWNPYTNEPLRDISEMYSVARRVAYSHPSRLEAVRGILEVAPRPIVFYNFDYELEILRELADTTLVAEWNGHKHQDVPSSDKWVYLVQYTAGSEGWNCTTTDTTIFHSLNYSYKVTHQSYGRIDRMNTPYTDLHYYTLRSQSWIDKAVWKTLQGKKSFNELGFAKSMGFKPF